MKKFYAILLCGSLCAALLSGCRANVNINTAGDGDDIVSSEDAGDTDDTKKDAAGTESEDGLIDLSSVEPIDTPSFQTEYEKLADESLAAAVEPYEVADDFSNVINAEDIIGGEYITEEFKDKLKDDLFVVADENGREFYEAYEFNTYSQTPNFVTVDSLMHSYHIYFAHLLKNIEKSYLSDTLIDMTEKLYSESLSQLDDAKGTDFEKAARRNVAYFAVPMLIFNDKAEIDESVGDIAKSELALIMDAEEITDSGIFEGLKEDYSQYKPRGYYASDEDLQKYFRVMMWYGRMTFPANDDDYTKSAALMSIAIDETVMEDWEKVYAVTSFFAGASDDLSVCEYLPALKALYGGEPSVGLLAEDKAKWDSFLIYAKGLDAPQIQSIPVYEDEENVIPGFRLMGQRFTIDGSIMQNLIYRSVEENDKEEKRLLPDVLDVPASLGSDAARDIVLSLGADKFPTYETRLNEVRDSLNSAGDGIWNASLYSGWLNTLKPLLDAKSDGYPSFMQSEEWTKKDLETFAGSYTELKHDTVLYAKQPMAEMGGGYEEDIDDRGYVEPEPLVYERFYNLAVKTRDGLDSYGCISAEDKDNLTLLADLSKSLLVISEKELTNELPTDEEFDLIRNYGGNIEHFWYEAMKDDAESEYFTTEEYPAALVTDVATDPNGQVLEAGVGNPREVYVVVPVDGTLRIATGSVYNFYEFAWPLSDRLTDEKWREMIGADPGEGFLYERDESIVNPDWTQSYRAERLHFDDYVE